MVFSLFVVYVTILWCLINLVLLISIVLLLLQSCSYFEFEKKRARAIKKVWNYLRGDDSYVWWFKACNSEKISQTVCKDCKQCDDKAKGKLKWCFWGILPSSRYFDCAKLLWEIFLVIRGTVYKSCWLLNGETGGWSYRTGILGEEQLQTNFVEMCLYLYTGIYVENCLHIVEKWSCCVYKCLLVFGLSTGNRQSNV